MSRTIENQQYQHYNTQSILAQDWDDDCKNYIITSQYVTEATTKHLAQKYSKQQLLNLRGSSRPLLESAKKTFERVFGPNYAALARGVVNPLKKFPQAIQVAPIATKYEPMISTTTSPTLPPVSHVVDKSLESAVEIIKRLNETDFDSQVGSILALSLSKADHSSMMGEVARCILESCLESSNGHLYSKLCGRLVNEWPSSGTNAPSQGNVTVLGDSNGRGKLLRDAILDQCQAMFSNGPQQLHHTHPLLDDRGSSSLEFKRKYKILLCFIGSLFVEGLVKVSTICQCVDTFFAAGPPTDEAVLCLLALLNACGPKLDSQLATRDGGPAYLESIYEGLQAMCGAPLLRWSTTSAINETLKLRSPSLQPALVPVSVALPVAAAASVPVPVPVPVPVLPSHRRLLKLHTMLTNGSLYEARCRPREETRPRPIHQLVCPLQSWLLVSRPHSRPRAPASCTSGRCQRERPKARQEWSKSRPKSNDGAHVLVKWLDA